MNNMSLLSTLNFEDQNVCLVNYEFRHAESKFPNSSGRSVKLAYKFESLKGQKSEMVFDQSNLSLIIN